LNGGGDKEAIGFDEIVSQFEPDDPKGMGGPVIIIEISICIDEGGFQNDPVNFLDSLPAEASSTATQLYLDINFFSRFLQNFLLLGLASPRQNKECNSVLTPNRPKNISNKIMTFDRNPLKIPSSIINNLLQAEVGANKG